MKQLISSAVLLLCLGGVAGIYPCSCIGMPSVCTSYGAAKAVFIGSVRVVENQLVKTDDGRDVITGQKAYVQVEKIFKGTIDPEVIFRSYGSSCDPEYKEGQRWLFYGYYNEKNKAWQIGACDRSTLIDDASDDLLYLQGLPKSSGRTRISGTLKHYEDDPEKGFSLVRNILGAKVQIIGTDKTYETYTDKNGVYEIYDLPAGIYAVKPEIPLGLIIRFPTFAGPISRSIADIPGFKLELKEKSCLGVGFVLSSDTQINGKVIGADGKILPRVCLRLEPVNKKTSSYFNKLDCTKDDGNYHLDQIPPGDYVIVANDDGEISGDEPFPRVYYPGTVEREKATTVTVTSGERLAGYNIHIPSQLPTRVLSGVLTTSDGRPVAKGFVEFDAIDVKKGYDGKTRTTVDAQGRFALTVLQGVKGYLRGKMFTYVGEYLNCPELDRLINAKSVSEVETKHLLMEVNSDISEIKLKFSFPYCVKSKD